MNSRHLLAVLQALFVTFLWSTSWVLIKIGLDDIPALTFAGLRYSLAFLVLLTYAMQRPHIRAELKTLTRRDWLWFGLLGLVFYTITQGTQFLALVYLPAVTLSLMLNFTSIVVAAMGIVWLSEIPIRTQWGGIVLFITGVLIYFHPVDIPAEQVLGLVIAVIGTVSNAAGAVIGRYVNRLAKSPALVITLVSMGIGSLTLLATGIIAQGMPTLDAQSWLIIGWLALVNTAFAFTLWNHTLRTLSAVESSVVNNTMLVQIALLAWIFLDESLSLKQLVGMGAAGVGILIVQAGPHLSRGAETKRPPQAEAASD